MKKKSNGEINFLLEKEKIVLVICLKEKSGKFAKMIFYFLKSEMLCTCIVKMTGKRTNFGDDKVLRIPCLLQFSGPKENIELFEEIALRA